MPDALTLWSLAVLVAIAMRRPGWIARRRARGGIAHRRDRVGVGYKSAVGTVHLSVRELAGHGAAFGGPGSGKKRRSCSCSSRPRRTRSRSIVDPKGSPALAETVRPRWTGLDTGRTSTRRSARPATLAGARSAARGGGLQPRSPARTRDAAHQPAL